MCYTRSIGVAQKHDFESTTPQTAQSWLIGQHNAFENRAFAWMPASSFAGSPRCEIQPRSIRTFSIKFSLFFRVFSSSAWLDFFSVQPAGLASWTGSTRFPKNRGVFTRKIQLSRRKLIFYRQIELSRLVSTFPWTSSWAGSTQLFYCEFRVELNSISFLRKWIWSSSTRTSSWKRNKTRRNRILHILQTPANQCVAVSWLTRCKWNNLFSQNKEVYSSFRTFKPWLQNLNPGTCGHIWVSHVALKFECSWYTYSHTVVKFESSKATINFHGAHTRTQFWSFNWKLIESIWQWPMATTWQ